MQQKHFLVFEDRGSDSPLVEKIWRCHSERAGTFLSVAQSHFEMAVTRHRGRTFLTLRGPETKATMAGLPPEGEWFGVLFKLGTFMPLMRSSDLRDRMEAPAELPVMKPLSLGTAERLDHS